MRQVRRRNNPNKEILIYNLMPHVTVIRLYTTRITKSYDNY